MGISRTLVPCPICGALKGEWCLVYVKKQRRSLDEPAYQRREKLHPQRVEAAKANPVRGPRNRARRSVDDQVRALGRRSAPVVIKRIEAQR